MTGFNHATTGAIIALVVKRPELALPMALVSHFVLDSLPHYGVPTERRRVYKSFYRLLASDAILVPTLLIALLLSHHYLAFWCAILAVSPDVVWAPRFLKEHLFEAAPSLPADPFSRFHKKIQWGERPWGWSIEICWSICAVTVLTRLF